MTSRAYGARSTRSPRSHYDVILIVTSFATELATPTVTDVRTDKVGNQKTLYYATSNNLCFCTTYQNGET